MTNGTNARPRGPGRTRSRPAVDRVRDGVGADTWTLSPTDLTFLWDECPSCFYNKVVLKQPRPRAPFPKVFGRIDRAMKDFYLGEEAEVVVPGTLPGVIGRANQWVKSGPIALPGCSAACCIRGRVDVLVDCDDGTTGVVDFKTSEPGTDHLEKYARQLHAYAWALERPAAGTALTVSTLGLLCFEPTAFLGVGAAGALTGDVVWIPVERDDAAFSAFLSDVGSVLEAPEPPAPAPNCAWCNLASAA